MVVAACVVQLINLLCDLIKGVAKLIAAQLQRINQSLINLSESAASNNNEIQIKLEKLASNGNETQLRLNSLEKKVQELQDQMNTSFEQLNQQLNKINSHRELKQKEEMMSTDEKTIRNDGEEMLKDTSSQSQLLDKFLFGPEEEQMVFESLCLKWNIKHFEQLILKGEHEFTSDIFPVYGFRLNAHQIRLTINPHVEIGLHLCFKDEQKEAQKVEVKPLPMVTFIIKDLSGRNRNIIRNQYYFFNELLGYNEFGYWSGLISKSEWNPLISAPDASLEVLVLVEPPTIINNPFSADGTITDTLRHYSRKLQMAKEGLYDVHVSPAFLTHAGGFRVTARMWMNEPIGVNKRGLLAGIRFLSGEFDSQLEFTFEYETSITLINQLDAKKSITIKKQEKIPNYCYVIIGSDDEICSGGFLVNDSLTYHVAIKPIQS